MFYKVVIIKMSFEEGYAFKIFAVKFDSFLRCIEWKLFRFFSFLMNFLQGIILEKFGRFQIFIHNVFLG